MNKYTTPNLVLTFYSMDIITYSDGTLEFTENGETDFAVNANPSWIQ